MSVPPTIHVINNQIIEIWWGTLKIDAGGDGKQGIN